MPIPFEDAVDVAAERGLRVEDARHLAVMCDTVEQARRVARRFDPEPSFREVLAALTDGPDLADAA
jgi:hypothetical protein